MKKESIITLTTDFASDLYVGQMKGKILSINPRAKIIDLTHKVQSYSILEAAFFIFQVCPTFPPETVHIVVIDPGVGTERRALVISTENYHYIGPDNGVFHFILDKEKVKKAVQIDMKAFPDASFTFHGRDVFAPIGAYLSLGKGEDEFGFQIDKRLVKRLALPKGCILYIDQFGNIITNIKKEFRLGEVLTISYKKRRIKAPFVRTFCDVKEGEYAILKGSSGYIEVDKNKASAARDLGVKVGDRIFITK